MSFLGNLRNPSGTSNLLEPFTSGLRALGRGLSEAFTDMMP